MEFHSGRISLSQHSLFCHVKCMFYNNCRNPRALIGSFLLSISGQTHEIYNLCDIDATSESRKFEKSICHFLTNRKRPFFLLANKRARRIMNLVASDSILFSRAFLSSVLT